MSCPADQHQFAPGSLICAACGTRRSALLAGGLPYASWVADAASFAETRHGASVLATDGSSDRRFLVREYVLESGSDPRTVKQRFIAAAKLLQGILIPSMQLLFGYTRGGGCYTVADSPAGSPLAARLTPGRVPEAETTAWLGAILLALQRLHGAATSAGPLFHGGLHLDDVLASGPAPGDGVDLQRSLYLDNLLSENPLPPEHFQELDLAAAAEIALTLAQGHHSPTERETRLRRIADPVLGAILEYLFGVHGTHPGSARAAADYLHLLQQAAAGDNGPLFRQAHGLSASPRLLRFFTPTQQAPAPPPPKPAPPPTPAPPAPPPPIPEIPFTPVPPVPPPPTSRPPKPSKPKRRFGCGGCLAVLLLVVGVGAIALVAYFSRSSNPPPRTLEITADPNPAPHNARVRLTWHASGYDRVELNGRQVNPEGSMPLWAVATHDYVLTGIGPDGVRDTRKVVLTVLGRSSPRPRPGHEAEPPPALTPVGGQQNIALAAAEAPPPATQGGINAALAAWQGDMLSNDPSRIAGNYAPQVDRYFLQKDVTRDYVRQYLSDMYGRGTTISAFRLTGITTAMEPDGSAIVRFNKDFTLQTPTGTQPGSAHSILHLREVDGAWKITSERDFKGANPRP